MATWFTSQKVSHRWTPQTPLNLCWRAFKWCALQVGRGPVKMTVKPKVLKLNRRILNSRRRRSEALLRPSISVKDLLNSSQQVEEAVKIPSQTRSNHERIVELTRKLNSVPNFTLFCSPLWLKQNHLVICLLLSIST